MFGFKNNKEKFNLHNVIVVRDIETTITAIPAHTTFAKYIDKADYNLAGYTLVGICGQHGGTGVVLTEWGIQQSDEDLMLNFANPMTTDRTNVTIKVQALYIINENNG